MKQYKQLPIPKDSAWDRTNWWKRNRPIWLQQIIEGITNIIKWIPTIYHDKNYDHCYIFEILKFKLIQQRKYLVEANRHTSIPEVNKYITLCLNLIERIQEDYYGMEYMDYHKKEYNWLDIEDKPDLKQLEIENKSENYDDYFKLYPNTFRKILKVGNKHYNEWDRETQAMELSRVNQKRCQDLLFKILNEKINYFWD